MEGVVPSAMAVGVPQMTSNPLMDGKAMVCIRWLFRDLSSYVYDINGNKYPDSVEGLWCTPLATEQTKVLNQVTICQWLWVSSKGMVELPLCDSSSFLGPSTRAIDRIISWTWPYKMCASYGHDQEFQEECVVPLSKHRDIGRK
ncbi:hypothetical protein ZWY2020_035627 [Hordeum vulgare]|nr:hypothetical protein ZWY2020_035627 [Hordeum vulgare]